MNTKLKIFTSLLMITALSTSANAGAIDDELKKQCQYLVYGDGKTNQIYDAYLIGVISGIQYITAEPTEFTHNANDGVKVNKACQNALSNISANGFESDFMWEAVKLMSKEYSKSKR